MESLWQELKRRRVFRTLAAYTIVAWLLVQITDVAAPALLLPDWISTLVVFLLILGFPIAAVLAWAYDVTPTADLTTDSKDDDELQQSSVNVPHERSIAVLPFTNLSSDPDSEFFSDGISEELASDLARIGTWKVAASTSCFYFKGRKEKVQTIARELGVKVVLEGSVRKVGSRVKVTAQLIDASDGYRLWSAVYENDVNDLLQVQESIAQSIVDALRVELSQADQQAFVASTREDAYQYYLRGRYLWQRRNPESIHQGIELLKRSIGLDENFGKAYAALAAAYHKMPLYDSNADKAVTQRLAESAARKALERDPRSGEARAILASILAESHRYEKAEEAFRQALVDQPGNATAQHWYAICLLNTGRIRLANEHISRAVDLDPLNGAIAGTAGSCKFAAGDVESAIVTFLNAVELGWQEPAHAFLGFAYLLGGNRDKARTHLEAGAFNAEQIPVKVIDALLELELVPGEDPGFSATVDECLSNEEISNPLAFRLCALTGALHVFDLEFDPADLTGDDLGTLWLPMAASIRKDARLGDLLARFRLPLHWPDFSTEQGTNIIEGKFVSE